MAFTSSLFDIRAQKGLRGCVGDPTPKESLDRLVPRIAVDAATNDFRFRPVKLDELRTHILVEVNVLGPLEPIVVSEPLDFVHEVKVGRDGVMVEGMGSKGLLLPEVGVEEGFDSEEFLVHCCLKAGLSPDAWLTREVRVSRFRTQTFTEEKPNGRVVERSMDPGKE
ncbi:MAG TPA: TIGR00296 family protein [Candidatus Bathyarchaeia archaeon]|nr:TIGR00296 family protein [Candidatus Bathyarchaeia archaeon]